MGARMKPDYRRVVDDLADRIASGAYQPGDRLPSRRELAVEFGCSASTVERALAILRDRGAIEGHQGKAMYVADPRT